MTRDDDRVERRLAIALRDPYHRYWRLDPLLIRSFIERDVIVAGLGALAGRQPHPGVNRRKWRDPISGVVLYRLEFYQSAGFRIARSSSFRQAMSVTRVRVEPIHLAIDIRPDPFMPRWLVADMLRRARAELREAVAQRHAAGGGTG